MSSASSHDDEGRIKRGSVFEFMFGPMPQSYLAVSYPHPTHIAKWSDKRHCLRQNLPKSLETGLRDLEKHKVKHIQNVSSNLDGHWFIYYTGAELHRAKKTNFGRNLQQMKHFPWVRYLCRLQGHYEDSRISSLTFGEEENSFFMRSTENEGNKWHSDWGTTVPEECGFYLKQNLNNVRAATLGRGGTWVLYGRDWHEWGGNLPPSLLDGLNKGREEGWVINKVVLSLVNENEYVLIYDHGVAYAAFHRDFKPEFDIVYDEWLEGQKNARPEQDYSQAEIFFDNNTAELEQPEKSNKAGSSSHTRTISDPRSSSSLATDRSLHTAAPDPIYEHSPPRYGQPRTPQYSSSPSKPPESSHQQTDSTPQPKPVAKSPSKTSPPPNQQDTRDRGFSGTFRGLLAGRQPIDETETTPKTADELWNIDEEWESISPEPRAIASMQPASDTSSRPSTVAYSLASSRPVSTSSVSNYSQDTLKIYQDTLKIYQDTLKMYPPQASHPTGASSNEQVGSISQSTIDSPKTGLKIRLDSSRSFRGSRPALKGWKSDSSSPVSPTKRVSFAEVPEGRDVQGESPSEVAIEQEAVESLKADLDTGDVVQASESPEESSETSGKNESEAPFEVNIEHNEAVEETESIEAKDSHVDENITEAQIINVEHIPPGSFPLDSMPTHELASSLTDGNSLAHLACLFISHFRKILTPGPAVGFKRVWWNCECGTELHVDLKQSGNFVDPKALHWYIYDPYGYCDVRIEQSGFRRYFSLPVTHAGPYNPSQGDISLERPTAEESGSGSISSSSSGTINPSNSQDKLNSNKKTGPKPRQRRRVAHPVHGENEEKKYFELCINMGVYEQHLGEINISSTKTDLSLFRSISDTYFRVRNGKGKALPFQRPIFTLLSKLVHRDFREIYIFEPQSVDFVKFQFDHRPGLGIIEEHSIPSISEINNGRYHYDPIPEGNYLPMPPDVFMHHFYSPDKFEHLPSKWLERLPKKLDTRLLDEDGDFGWGVHFREGMRWDVLSLLLFSITVVSMIGVLVVALVKGFETGIAFGQFVFGAAAFWVAGKTFLLQRESHGGVQKLR